MKRTLSFNCFIGLPAKHQRSEIFAPEVHNVLRVFTNENKIDGNNYNKKTLNVCQKKKKKHNVYTDTSIVLTTELSESFSEFVDYIFFSGRVRFWNE